ncbi:MAG: hypothetical protein S4CHLAM20_14120 [Chlamydiia bacterium]|nr:hypothetical protein [Chlamydiia bacterium]
MKNLLLLLAVTFSCFGVQLKITRIVDDLNVYIFEKKYVIKTDRPIAHVKVGNRLDIDTGLFYNEVKWNQDIITTKRVKTGTTYQRGYDYIDEYGNRVGEYTQSVDQYGYRDEIDRYTFTPIGVLLNQKPMDLMAFHSFVKLRSTVQPLSSFTSIFSDINWFHIDKDVFQDNFSTAQAGNYVTMDYLLDTYSLYEKGYKHRIYPIFDRNNTHYLAGVLNLAKRRKVCLHDHTYSLALFEYQDVVYQ